jgi:hypothetical protein
LHSGKHNEELCAFDVLAMDGDDLRDLPLSMRKTNLARLLARRPDGIFVSDFEQGEIGPDLFRKACEFGFEGLVSKHRNRPYQTGWSKHWIKVKNRTPGDVMESFLTDVKRLAGEPLVWAARFHFLFPSITQSNISCDRTGLAFRRLNRHHGEPGWQSTNGSKKAISTRKRRRFLTALLSTRLKSLAW